MSIPVFVTVKTNGEIWVSSDAAMANAVGGTVHKVTFPCHSTKIAIANGTSSITSTKGSGSSSDISNL